MKRKNKKIIDRLLIFAIIILVLVSGIGIGIVISSEYLNKSDKKKDEGTLEYYSADMKKVEQIIKANNAIQVNSSQPTSSDGDASSTSAGSYVASSRGKKYYPVDCSAAASLSENNKVYFGSQEEAESSGYTKSSSCEF